MWTKLGILFFCITMYSNLNALDIENKSQFEFKTGSEIKFNQIDILTEGYEVSLIELNNLQDSSVVNKTSIKKKKFIAVTLAVTLGVFGVHRLYLGTSTKVPIIYTLTLGGGFGVLVVSDIIAIIATKDINKYSQNTKVFMWAE